MSATDSIDLTVLANHRRIRNVWLGVIIAGLVLFGGLLVLSYFLLNTPSITQDAIKYRNVEAALGFSEIAGLVIALLALFRYLNLKAGYRKQLFDQLVANNGWSAIKKYDIDKVAGILLGAGTSYEEGYAYNGKHGGQTFSCLVFQYDATDSKTRRFLCLNFKLPKSYPMIVIDNKLNDHGFRRHDSDLPNRIPNGVEVSLEGNFDKFYRVSTTKGSEREAVQALSPDFMVELIDAANDKVDIEISNRDLFLVYDADFYTEQNMNALFDVADSILDHMSRLSKTWEAGSKYEEQVVERSAASARHKLIYRTDYLSAIGALLVFIFVIMLMVSDIRSQNYSNPSPTNGKVRQLQP